MLLKLSDKEYRAQDTLASGMLQALLLKPRFRIFGNGLLLSTFASCFMLYSMLEEMLSVLPVLSQAFPVFPGSIQRKL